MLRKWSPGCDKCSEERLQDAYNGEEGEKGVICFVGSIVDVAEEIFSLFEDVAEHDAS